MTTKYDVFAKIIEKAPCKQKDLGFPSPTYAHLRSLVENGFIKKTKEGYLPVKTKTTESIFKIIKLCLDFGLDYNVFFLKDFFSSLIGLENSIPVLRPKKIQNNKQRLTILKFLEKNQFILVYNKKPKHGTLLRSKLLELIYSVNKRNICIVEEFLDYTKIRDLIFCIPKKTLNPFDTKYFACLTGSAQLEGSTITLGETVDLLTKEIYPDKSAKDIQMVKNLNEAMRLVLNNIDNPVTQELIRSINEKVLFSLHRGAGQYKKSPNKIHGNPSFKTTSPELVPIEIEQFCDFLNKIRTREDCLNNIGKVHNYIQRIHPFPDGNSRTTRMIVNWLLLKFEFPLVILRTGSYDKYMSITKLSPLRSDNDVRNFFLHLILHEHLNAGIV